MSSHPDLKLCPVCSWDFKDGQYRTSPYPTEAEKSEKRPRWIAFCGNCGIGIANPLWEGDELEDFYSKGGYWGHSKTEILLPKKYPVPYTLAVSRWKLIGPFFEKSGKPISMLDIGAGHGFLGMVAAKTLGSHLSTYVCVEKDRTLRESLGKTWSVFFPRNNLRIVDHIGHVDGKFDCIILSHLLEHVAHPKALLHAVSEKMAKFGFLFIDVPNQDYLFKKDVFPHLLFFSNSSLQYLLESCGLTIKSIYCYGNDMDHSRMNFRNASKVRSLLIETMMRASIIIPENLIFLFFNRYFETDKQNNNGIWIRALCQDSHSEEEGVNP
ncbi:MAG: class I SAM-dependent methyltransferase [Thermodesulfobacteriota bacterium]